MRIVFDGFELDSDACQLLRDGVAVPLEPRALDLLCYLAARPGQLLRKDELLAQVWRAQRLSDGVLSNTVSKLRHALGHGERDQSPIETVRGRGYRWRAVARAVPPVAASVSFDTFVRPPAANEACDPFVGRAAVLEQLSHAIELAARGVGQLVLIAGEAGIGKTRTLEQLSQRARARGFGVWEGAAYDGAGAPAYWPWVEILRAAHAELSDEVWQCHQPREPRALSLLVPELIGNALAVASETQPARFRLFDEIARFIAAVSGEVPRLIVLDDLHWADVATLELLVHAASVFAKRPILVAAAVRDHDGSLTSMHVAAIRRLERLGTRIALAGLAVAEVAELVGVLQGSAHVDARLNETLHRRTQGNPFFVRQIMALFAQRATPADAVSVESMGLPVAVHGVVQQRVAGLEAAARSVLTAAAVIGQEFDACLLANVLDLTLDETLTALEPARGLGVIERRASAPHCFGFSHALLREVLYEELEWTRCGALHAKLAHALADQPLSNDARRLGEVARHYLLAVPSELESCVHYCYLAADAAREACGFEAAAELLSRALHKLTSESGSEATCCDLLLTLGFDQLCSGDAAAAWKTLERGAALAHSMRGAELLAGFACRMADWLELGGDERQTRARLDQALAAVSADRADLRAALLARRAKVHYELPAEQRDALLDAAEDLARRCGLPAVQIDVAFCRANLRDPTRPEYNRAAAARYREVSRQYPEACTGIRDQLRHVSADVAEYFAAFTAGDITSADRAITRWCAAAREFHVTAFSTLSELALAGRALAAGRLDELEVLVPRGIERANESGVPRPSWYLYLILLAEARGQLQDWSAIEVPSSSDELATRNSHHQLVQQLWVAWFYARTGRKAAARGTLHTIAAAQLARMPVMFGDLGLLCLLAETYYELGDTQGARRLQAQLAPHAALNAVGMIGESRGCVAYYVGMLAELLGDTHEAISQLERAERVNHALRMPWQLERTRAQLAQCRARVAPKPPQTMLSKHVSG